MKIEERIDIAELISDALKPNPNSVCGICHKPIGVGCVTRKRLLFEGVGCVAVHSDCDASINPRPAKLPTKQLSPCEARNLIMNQ